MKIPPFDIGVPKLDSAGGIMNAMNAWMSGLTNMGELEWMGMITIGFATAVLVMALVGISTEMSRGKTGQVRY